LFKYGSGTTILSDYAFESIFFDSNSFTAGLKNQHTQKLAFIWQSISGATPGSSASLVNFPTLDNGVVVNGWSHSGASLITYGCHDDLGSYYAFVGEITSQIINSTTVITIDIYKEQLAGWSTYLSRFSPAIGHYSLMFSKFE